MARKPGNSSPDISRAYAAMVFCCSFPTFTVNDFVSLKHWKDCHMYSLLLVFDINAYDCAVKSGIKHLDFTFSNMKCACQLWHLPFVSWSSCIRFCKCFSKHMSLFRGRNQNCQSLIICLCNLHCPLSHSDLVRQAASATENKNTMNIIFHITTHERKTITNSANSLRLDYVTESMWRGGMYNCSLSGFALLLRRAWRAEGLVMWGCQRRFWDFTGKDYSSPQYHDGHQRYCALNFNWILRGCPCILWHKEVFNISQDVGVVRDQSQKIPAEATSQ